MKSGGPNIRFGAVVPARLVMKLGIDKACPSEASSAERGIPRMEQLRGLSPRRDSSVSVRFHWNNIYERADYFSEGLLLFVLRPFDATIQSPMMNKKAMVTIAINAEPVKDWIVFANSSIRKVSMIKSPF